MTAPIEPGICPGVGFACEGFVGTCDAGNCDAETEAVIYCADGQWISMCRDCARRELVAACG